MTLCFIGEKPSPFVVSDCVSTNTNAESPQVTPAEFGFEPLPSNAEQVSLVSKTFYFSNQLVAAFSGNGKHVMEFLPSLNNKLASEGLPIDAAAHLCRTVTDYRALNRKRIGVVAVTPPSTESGNRPSLVGAGVSKNMESNHNISTKHFGEIQIIGSGAQHILQDILSIDWYVEQRRCFEVLRDDDVFAILLGHLNTLQLYGPAYHSKMRDWGSYFQGITWNRSRNSWEHLPPWTYIPLTFDAPTFKVTLEGRSFMYYPYSQKDVVLGDLWTFGHPSFGKNGRTLWKIKDPRAEPGLGSGNVYRPKAFGATIAVLYPKGKSGLVFPYTVPISLIDQVKIREDDGHLKIGITERLAKIVFLQVHEREYNYGWSPTSQTSYT